MCLVPAGARGGGGTARHAWDGTGTWSWGQSCSAWTALVRESEFHAQEPWCFSELSHSLGEER